MNETFARWDAAEELIHHPEGAARTMPTVRAG